MRFSRRSTLPTNTGTLPPWSVMTWNWSRPCSSRPRVRRARNCWMAVSRAQIDRKIRLPWSSPTQASAITSEHSSIRHSVVEEVFAGMVVSSDEREQHRPLGQVLPQGVEENRSVRLELPGVRVEVKRLIYRSDWREALQEIGRAHV